MEVKWCQKELPTKWSLTDVLNSKWENALQSEHHCWIPDVIKSQHTCPCERFQETKKGLSTDTSRNLRSVIIQKDSLLTCWDSQCGKPSAGGWAGGDRGSQYELSPLMVKSGLGGGISIEPPIKNHSSIWKTMMMRWGFGKHQSPDRYHQDRESVVSHFTSFITQSHLCSGVFRVAIGSQAGQVNEASVDFNNVVTCANRKSWKTDKRSAYKLATRDHARVFVAGVRGRGMIKKVFWALGGSFWACLTVKIPDTRAASFFPLNCSSWRKDTDCLHVFFSFFLSPLVAIEAAQKNTDRSFQSSSWTVNCLESNFNAFLGVILIWKTSGGFEHISSLLGSGLSQQEDENLQGLLLLAVGSSFVSYCQCLVFSLKITLRTHRYFWQSSVCSELFYLAVCTNHFIKFQCPSFTYHLTF